MKSKPEKPHWWNKVKCQHQFGKPQSYVETCIICGYVRIAEKQKAKR